LADVLDELWSGTTLVLSHKNADIDALGCSIALASMFPGVTIGAVESVSRGAQNLMRYFGDRYPVVVDPEVDEDASPYSRLMFVDTSTPTQVEPYDDFLKRSIVIDHHTVNPDLRSANPRYICDPRSPSCAQLIYRLAMDAGAEVNEDASRALVAGILADTERFRIAPTSAVKDAVEILQAGGVELSDVIETIERPSYDRSQAIAVLKSAQRSEFFEVGPFILARSRVGAFEASAARHLVFMGADIAMVAGEEKGTTSITGRVGKRALRAGFNLGSFFQRLAELTGGDGGGHAGAAGFSAKGAIDDVEAQALELARAMVDALEPPSSEDG
jgi:nanoRNase/pAp phosphatase (c-di-AMP/oligoRNAs hydrolase)